MKQTMLLLAMLCISFSLMANINETGNGLSRLMKLFPEKVTQSKVRDIFGEATIININNKTGEESWEYKGEQEDLLFRWDTKNNRLKALNFTSRAKSKEKWSNHYLLPIEIGASTVKQVIRELGNPSGMSIRPNEQKLSYNYADNTLELQFRGSVLANLRIYNTEGRESNTYITIE